MAREKVRLIMLRPILRQDSLQKHFIRKESRTNKSGELPDTMVTERELYGSREPDPQSYQIISRPPLTVQSNTPATVLNGNGDARLWFIIQLFSGSFNQDPHPQSSKVISDFLWKQMHASFTMSNKLATVLKPIRRHILLGKPALPYLNSNIFPRATTGYRLFLEVMFPRLAKQFLHSSLTIEDSDIDGANGRVCNDRRIKSVTIQLLTTISFFIPAAAETSFSGNDCLFSESQARAFPHRNTYVTA
ncbi:hypothetical protein EDD85DRAFT_789787 [Armillaria nabsnona]|nr:hypothetical protein EDD85DRAFT_789787 [Armillaria nabsnona]